MPRSKRVLYSVLAAVFVGLVGCSTVDVPTVKPVVEQQPQQQVVAEFTAVGNSDEVLVNNGEDLDNRITITDEAITFNSDSLTTQSVEATLGLKLVAHIKSPVVEGETVQATAVRVENGTLVASYNMKGPKFLGAVDIVDLNDNFTGRTAKYTTADVHSVAFRDNTIYTVQGFSDDSLDYTARMQMLALDASEVKEVPIKGYVANSVLVDEKQVYVTSGSNGGLTVLSRDNLDDAKMYGLTGARWVDIDGDRLAMAVGSETGQNGELVVANMSNLDSMLYFDVKGMNLPEAKSTVDLYKDYAFVAAGPTGVQVHSLKTGKAIGAVKPEITNAATERFVANAASVDMIGKKEYLFLANGEGVYAAEFKVEGENFKHQMLGKLNFEAAESINHVLVTDRYLILAAGLEGVYILSVEDNSPPLEQCGPNAIDNGSFEANYVKAGAYALFNESQVAGWSTTSSDNLIEIWGTGHNQVASYDGDYHAEINATQNAALYQDIATTPGDTMHWSIWHRGRSGVDTGRILIGAPGSEVQVATMTTDNTEWKQYTGSYVVPAGQTTTRLSFEAVSTASNNASIGNLIDLFQVSSCGPQGVEQAQPEPQPESQPELVAASCFSEDLVFETSDSLKVEYSLNNKWEGNNGTEQFIQGTFKVTNAGSEAVSGWKFAYDSQMRLKDSEMWNGKYYGVNNDRHVVANLDWNGDLKPGQAVEVGFNAMCVVK